MWLKRLTLEGEIVKNPSVSLTPTLARNEKVEHYIRIKIHKLIALRFWVKSGVNALCGWAQVSLLFVIPSDTPSLDLTYNTSRTTNHAWWAKPKQALSMEIKY